MTDVTELWKTIPSAPCYEASTLGRIRSKSHITSHGHRRQSTVLSQRVAADGYCTVTLTQGVKKRPYRVHLLIAETFLGERPPGADVRHGPGGKQDNRKVNLSYGTRAENEQDKKRDGTFNHGGSPRGEANQNARLTESDIRAIRRYYAQGMTQTAIAAEYPVSQATVSAIVNRKTWTHLP